MHTTGIYEIRNLVNGKRYVGSAVKFSERWKKHTTQLERGTHHSSILQRAWRKHGASAFEFRKLIICGRENLLMYEQAAMDAFRPEYNIEKKAGSPLGVKRSAETIAKRTATRAANGFSPSEEVRKRISLSLKGRPGRIPSEETRARMSAASKGKLTPHLIALRDAKVGKPRADWVRVKLSQANARLTEDQVRSIRKRYASGEMQKTLALEFMIRPSCISEIVNRKTYGWVV